MQKLDLRSLPLNQTCEACPSQWEAEPTETTPAVYIRYRFGHLSISTGATVQEAVDSHRNNTSFSTRHGHGLDGSITLEEVIAIYERQTDGYT